MGGHAGAPEIKPVLPRQPPGRRSWWLGWRFQTQWSASAMVANHARGSRFCRATRLWQALSGANTKTAAEKSPVYGAIGATWRDRPRDQDPRPRAPRPPNNSPL